MWITWLLKWRPFDSSDLRYTPNGTCFKTWVFPFCLRSSPSHWKISFSVEKEKQIYKSSIFRSALFGMRELCRYFEIFWKSVCELFSVNSIFYFRALFERKPLGFFLFVIFIIPLAFEQFQGCNRIFYLIFNIQCLKVWCRLIQQLNMQRRIQSLA